MVQNSHLSEKTLTSGAMNQLSVDPTNVSVLLCLCLLPLCLFFFFCNALFWSLNSPCMFEFVRDLSKVNMDKDLVNYS